MRVLFWVPYPSEGASNRYRVEQFLRFLKKEGILFSLHPFWRSSAFKVLYKRGYRLRKGYFFIVGTLSRTIDLIQIFRYDIVFIHREAYPIGGAFFENILSLCGKPLIFDFDDAIFLPASSPLNNFIERFKRPDKVAKIIKMCRQVIAGNRYLADFAKQYHREVSVIPTSIDTDRYCLGANKAADIITVGWMGSITTVDFLDALKAVFIRLSERFGNLRFKIVGGTYSIAGLSNITSKPWSLEEEVDDLRSFDIGIMPMPDNKWTHGKCGFKAILYMSMGIPCVSSPVGVNKEIISDGINGFLADNDEKWVEKISLLIKNPELRNRIGLAARKTVEEKYSVQANAGKFLEVIKKANR